MVLIVLGGFKAVRSLELGLQSLRFRQSPNLCESKGEASGLSSGTPKHVKLSAQLIGCDQVFVEECAKLRRSLLRFEVHVRDPEPLFESVGPFEVVQQTP